MENKSIISVLGESKIITQPDYVSLWFTIQKLSSTINESQKAVNRNVNKLLTILKNYAVEDIKTNYIDLRQEKDWNDRSKFVGHKYTQSISGKIYNLDKNMENLKNVLDNISIDNNDFEITISFKVKDLGKLAIDVRELAYKDALEKAIHYAKISNLTIIKAIKISEFPPNERSNIWYSSVENTKTENLENDLQTNIPIGNLEFGTKLYCDFLAEEI